MRGHRLSWAVGGISLLVLCLAGPAAATTIDFDDVELEGYGLFAADRYQSQGAIFSREIPIAVVNDINPLFTSYFVGGGGVANALVLSPSPLTPDSGSEIVVTFVVPGTLNQGVTDFVELDFFDSQRGSMGRLEAYNLDGELIASVERQRDATRHHVYSISAEGIAWIRLTDEPFEAPDGTYYDNLTFNTPTAVPEPSTWLLLGAALAGLGLAHRRTRS